MGAVKIARILCFAQNADESASLRFRIESRSVRVVSVQVQGAGNLNTTTSLARDVFRFRGARTWTLLAVSKLSLEDCTYRHPRANERTEAAFGPSSIYRRALRILRRR